MNLVPDMKLYALIITYKNVASLKKCLNRLFLQSEFLNKIVVVNNASNDETEIYLKSLMDKVDVINLKNNTGGAGGYYYGLNYCVEKGADWVWCVEDDILSSRNFARNFIKLTANKQTELSKIGFFYPKVMSVLSRYKIEGSVKLILPHQTYFNLQLLERAQFAGCLLNAEAIKKVGLPMKEFFIYYDDWEFTERLIRNGYYGLWLDHFFVWHNASETSQSQVYLTRRRNDVWKHFYGIRNELYILRKRNFMAFIKPFLWNLVYIPCLILVKRKDYKLYVAFNWFWWTLKSLFFNARIDFPIQT